MKYNVENLSESGEYSVVSGLSKREAIKTAREAAEKYPDNSIFITWFRASDGQHGYLNPSGDHAITGQAW